MDRLEGRAHGRLPEHCTSVGRRRHFLKHHGLGFELDQGFELLQSGSSLLEVLLQTQTMRARGRKRSLSLLLRLLSKLQALGGSLHV